MNTIITYSLLCIVFNILVPIYCKWDYKAIGFIITSSISFSIPLVIFLLGEKFLYLPTIWIGFIILLSLVVTQTYSDVREK